MSYILNRIQQLFYHKQACCFYRGDNQVSAARECQYVHVYRKWKEVPSSFRRILAPNPLINGLYYRLRFGTITLICHSKDGHHLDGYGCILPARQYRRQWGSILEKNGIMLAHFWTAPARRRQGLYGQMLRHALTLCPNDHAVYIYTTVPNVASQKGIEKAGFIPFGRWESRLILSNVRIIHPIQQDNAREIILN